MDKPNGALSGIRVIDLSRVLGGPYCTQVLGDYGADVIKIEPPGGDETRGWGPPFEGDAASYFHGLNRSKRGMALDLRHPDGKALLLQLLEGADVLVENFKPGTLEKWGLSYDILSARFPRLIQCRISGFGADGPMGGLPGYDAIIQAMAGLMSVNGEKQGEPLRVGLPIVDIVTGLNAVIGITLALHERTRSGRGQFVETALFDSGLSYEVYRTATQPIFLAVGNNVQFARLCELLECHDVSQDERFATNGARLGNRAALRDVLESAMARWEGDKLADRLMRIGVPCGPVLDTTQALAHPHTQHRDMIVKIGHYKGTGSPIKLARTPSRYETPPPRFAEHTNAILHEAGLTEQQIEHLRAKGVLPDVPVA